MQTELQSANLTLSVSECEDSAGYNVTLSVDGQARLLMTLTDITGIVSCAPDYVLAVGTDEDKQAQVAPGESVLDADDHTVHAWLHERLRRVEDELKPRARVRGFEQLSELDMLDVRMHLVEEWKQDAGERLDAVEQGQRTRNERQHAGR